MRLLIAMCLWATHAAAQDIAATAGALYASMPRVVVVDVVAGNCGATPATNGRVVYCTSRNRIFMARQILQDASAPYELAHQYGHAIFVQHGLADVALGAIRANRSREAELRGQVTRQIECLAGVIYARAGYPLAQLDDWFATEPFTGAHWGRDPLRVGPRVSVGMDVRAEWFLRGQQSAHPSACAVPDLPTRLLLDPFRG